jgi:ABC-type transport system involved in multi-copper enzyme maturation permease subunit
MSKSKRRVKTKTVTEKPSEIEPISDKVTKILSQSLRLFWEEVKNFYRQKWFVAFAILMVLPMIFILVPYAITQYPTYLNQVQISIFLNGIYPSGGAITTFRDIFAQIMGIGVISFGGFATAYYTGIPIIATVTLLNSGIIASERDKGTFPIYVSKPIYKTQLVLTKFLAFAFISLILTAVVFYTMYSVLAFSILAPLGLLAEGLKYTIYAVNSIVIIVWFFIIAVGSVTMLFSSIVDRPLLAGVISLMYLLVVYIFSNFPMRFLGSLGDALKYIDPSSLSNTLLTVNVLGLDYYRTVWNIITSPGGGLFASSLLGRLDPTVAATLLISIILVTIIATCIITEKREVK